MTAPPIPPMEYVWHDGALRPLKPRLAASRLVEGEVYSLAPHEERSKRSHDHWFVSVEEAFKNLPEDTEGRWLSVEHFRKWVLVRAGWCDELTVACETKAEAERVAALSQKLDGYAVVILRDKVVSIYTAKSQSYAAMKSGEFRAVKERGLKVLADLLGVEPEALSHHARAAA